MALLTGILLGLAALLIVVHPLLGIGSPSTDISRDVETKSEVAEAEQTARLALRDVEFDFRLGTLDEQDYEALHDRYERRALVALKSRYENDLALEKMIDDQLDAMRTAILSSHPTTATGHPARRRQPAGRPRHGAHVRSRKE